MFFTAICIQTFSPRTPDSCETSMALSQACKFWPESTQLRNSLRFSSAQPPILVDHTHTHLHTHLHTHNTNTHTHTPLHPPTHTHTHSHPHTHLSRPLSLSLTLLLSCSLHSPYVSLTLYPQTWAEVELCPKVGNSKMYLIEFRSSACPDNDVVKVGLSSQANK